MPLNKQFIGKEYPSSAATVTLDALQKYARAYNDDNPHFFDPATPGGIIAPPLFGVAVTWLSAIQPVADAELGVDVMRLLHAEQDMEFLAPLRPGDEIISTAKVAAIDSRPSGESLVLEIMARNAVGQPVLRILSVAFIRATRRDRSAAASATARSAERPTTPQGDPLLAVIQTIDRDQTFRYAEASGDHNPIHVDESSARMAGLPGIIVHGLCTMAFTSKVVIDGLGGGDPVRLKRLRVQFTRPVFPGTSITTKVWPEGDRSGRRAYAFETYNPDGLAVIRGGIAEIAP